MPACLGGGGDGYGVVVEVRGHGVEDLLVEAVIIAEVYVVAAEAAIELAGN